MRIPNSLRRPFLFRKAIDYRIVGSIALLAIGIAIFSISFPLDGILKCSSFSSLKGSFNKDVFQACFVPILLKTYTFVSLLFGISLVIVGLVLARLKVVLQRQKELKKSSESSEPVPSHKFPKKIGIVFVEKIKRQSLPSYTAKDKFHSSLERKYARFFRTRLFLNFNQDACALLLLQLNRNQTIFDFQVIDEIEAPNDRFNPLDWIDTLAHQMHPHNCGCRLSIWNLLVRIQRNVVRSAALPREWY